MTSTPEETDARLLNRRVHRPQLRDNRIEVLTDPLGVSGSSQHAVVCNHVLADDTDGVQVHLDPPLVASLVERDLCGETRRVSIHRANEALQVVVDPLLKSMRHMDKVSLDGLCERQASGIRQVVLAHRVPPACVRAVHFDLGSVDLHCAGQPLTCFFLRSPQFATPSEPRCDEQRRESTSDCAQNAASEQPQPFVHGASVPDAWGGRS